MYPYLHKLINSYDIVLFAMSSPGFTWLNGIKVLDGRQTKEMQFVWRQRIPGRYSKPLLNPSSS